MAFPTERVKHYQQEAGTMLIPAGDRFITTFYEFPGSFAEKQFQFFRTGIVLLSDDTLLSSRRQQPEWYTQQREALLTTIKQLPLQEMAAQGQDVVSPYVEAISHLGEVVRQTKQGAFEQTEENLDALLEIGTEFTFLHTADIARSITPAWKETANAYADFAHDTSTEKYIFSRLDETFLRPATEGAQEMDVNDTFFPLLLRTASQRSKILYLRAQDPAITDGHIAQIIGSSITEVQDTLASQPQRTITLSLEPSVATAPLEVQVFYLQGQAKDATPSEIAAAIGIPDTQVVELLRAKKQQGVGSGEVDVEDLRKKLKGISNKELAFYLRGRYGLKYREIAQVLGLTNPKTVENYFISENKTKGTISGDTKEELLLLCSSLWQAGDTSQQSIAAKLQRIGYDINWGNVNYYLKLASTDQRYRNVVKRATQRRGGEGARSDQVIADRYDVLFTQALAEGKANTFTLRTNIGRMVRSEMGLSVKDYWHALNRAKERSAGGWGRKGEKAPIFSPDAYRGALLETFDPTTRDNVIRRQDRIEQVVASHPEILPEIQILLKSPDITQKEMDALRLVIDTVDMLDATRQVKNNVILYNFLYRQKEKDFVIQFIPVVASSMEENKTPQVRLFTIETQEGKPHLFPTLILYPENTPQPTSESKKVRPSIYNSLDKTLLVNAQEVDQRTI